MQQNFSVPTSTINIELPYSKSILNRVLIIESLLGNQLNLDIESECNDVRVLYQALQAKEETIDIEDAGTPYRFLMAYFAVMGLDKTLQASPRLTKRPIRDLAKVLIENGCSIKYLEDEGFPPISIVGLANLKKEISIDPKLSSQFVSALMLVAPYQKEKTTILLENSPTSLPYIKLTANVMEYYGVKSNFYEDKLSLKGNYSSKEKSYPLESDWSAASYFYAFSVLTEVEMTFPKLSLDSSQGDKYVAEVFSSFGIKTTQKEVNSVSISYNQEMYSPPTNIDLSNHPDLAPTLIVLVACLKANTSFTGLENLKIKESDRVLALQTELKKVGIYLTEEDSVWRVSSENVELQDIPTFNTHEDHRIAMSLSLLSVFGEIKIENKEVVVKSFPYFWKELDKLDLEIE